MGDERTTRAHASAWRFFYLPTIVGLILGVALASGTDHWWWAPIGVVAGGVVGDVVRRGRHGRSGDS